MNCSGETHSDGINIFYSNAKEKINNYISKTFHKWRVECYCKQQWNAKKNREVWLVK